MSAQQSLFGDKILFCSLGIINKLGRYQRLPNQKLYYDSEPATTFLSKSNRTYQFAPYYTLQVLLVLVVC